MATVTLHMVWLLADTFLDRPVYDKVRINIYKLTKRKRGRKKERKEGRKKEKDRASFQRRCEKELFLQKEAKDKNRI